MHGTAKTANSCFCLRLPGCTQMISPVAVLSLSICNIPMPGMSVTRSTHTHTAPPSGATRTPVRPHVEHADAPQQFLPCSHAAEAEPCDRLGRQASGPMSSSVQPWRLGGIPFQASTMQRLLPEWQSRERRRRRRRKTRGVHALAYKRRTRLMKSETAVFPSLWR